jgi:hypothetical protein
MAMRDPYSDMKAASCMPQHCFCEAIRFGDWIRQPSNAWSNLAFTCVAIFILWVFYRANAERSNRLARYPVYTWLFAFGSFLIGFGSFYYHASLTFIGQWFDVMGMYFTVIFFIMYNIDRLCDLKPTKFILIYLAINTVLAYVLYCFPEMRRYLFGTFVGIFLMSVWYVQAKVKTKINAKYLYLSMFFLALGFALWMLDIDKNCMLPLWFVAATCFLACAFSNIIAANVYLLFLRR